MQICRVIDPNSLLSAKLWDLLKMYGDAKSTAMHQVVARIFLVRDLLFNFMADRGCTIAWYL